MFSDMEGFTAMTERLGDLQARDVIRDHNRIVRQQVAALAGALPSSYAMCRMSNQICVRGLGSALPVVVQRQLL